MTVSVWPMIGQRILQEADAFGRDRQQQLVVLPASGSQIEPALGEERANRRGDRNRVEIDHRIDPAGRQDFGQIPEQSVAQIHGGRRAIFQRETPGLHPWLRPGVRLDQQWSGRCGWRRGSFDGSCNNAQVRPRRRRECR